jgi:hypothetical protein
MIPRLHALADAFANMNGAAGPTSVAYRLRNPLLLKAFSPKHIKDETSGCRIFKTLTAGIDNGLIDLKIKCSGNSFSKIGPDSSLSDLVCLYGNPRSATRFIVNFLRHALEDETISDSIKLSWFLESPEVKE